MRPQGASTPEDLPVVGAGNRAMVSSDAPPLIGLLGGLTAWIEHRHLALMAERGFDDVRRAHNAVFANLPADGIRLTDLAEVAGMSKQAMGELVADLIDKGYLTRRADPTDGRAKLITAAKRGEDAHLATMEIFGIIDADLADAVGAERLAEAKATLLDLVKLVVPRDGPLHTAGA